MWTYHWLKALGFPTWKNYHHIYLGYKWSAAFYFQFSKPKFFSICFGYAMQFLPNKKYMLFVFSFHIETSIYNIMYKYIWKLCLCVFWFFKSLLLSTNERMVEDQWVIEKSQIYCNKNYKNVKDDFVEVED